MNMPINMLERPFLPYSELLRRHSIEALRESDIPVDHSVSLGLPTCRWFGPGYVFFASPALRRPGLPIEQLPPDRWWVLDAHTGRLIVYALTDAIPFCGNTEWSSVTLPATSRSIQDQIAIQARLSEFLDRLAPAFFRGEPADPAWRQAFITELLAMIPEPLKPQYDALVPDFLAWLKA